MNLRFIFSWTSWPFPGVHYTVFDLLLRQVWRGLHLFARFRNAGELQWREKLLPHLYSWPLQHGWECKSPFTTSRLPLSFGQVLDLNLISAGPRLHGWQRVYWCDAGLRDLYDPLWIFCNNASYRFGFKLRSAGTGLWTLWIDNCSQLLSHFCYTC